MENKQDIESKDEIIIKYKIGEDSEEYTLKIPKDHEKYEMGKDYELTEYPIENLAKDEDGNPQGFTFVSLDGIDADDKDLKATVSLKKYEEAVIGKETIKTITITNKLSEIDNKEEEIDKSENSKEIESEISENATLALKTSSLVVEKNWSDPEAEHEPVEVELMHTGTDGVKTPTGDKIILNKDNGWKGVFNGLEVPEDGKSFAYSVRENNVPTGYTPSYGEIKIQAGTPATGDYWVPSSDEELQTGKTYVFRVEGQSFALSHNPEKNLIRDQVTVHTGPFTPDGQVVDDYLSDVDPSSPWTVTYKMQDKGDGFIFYNANGGTFYIKGETCVENESDAKVNQYLTNGYIFYVESAKTFLHWSEHDQRFYLREDKDEYKDKLEKFKLYERGTVPDTYKTVITNSKSSEATSPFLVKKEWTDGNEGKSSIGFYVLKNGVRLGKEYTLNEQNNWQITLDLPTSGNHEEYTVEEVPVPDGYTVSYSRSEEPEISETYSYKLLLDIKGDDIEAHKEDATIYYMLGEDSDDPKDWQTLYIPKDGGHPKYDVHAGIIYDITEDLDADSKAKIKNIPAGPDGKPLKFYFKKLDSNDADPGDLDGSMVDFVPISDSSIKKSKTTLTILNTPIPKETKALEVKKEWQDDSGNLADPDISSVDFYIIKDGKRLSDESGKEIVYTLKKSDGWKTSIDLPTSGSHEEYSLETKAATGYDLPKNDFYFIWMSQNESEDTAKDLAGANDSEANLNGNSIKMFSNNGGVSDIKNTFTGLSVEKIWLDKDKRPLEKTPDEVAVVLYQLTKDCPYADDDFKTENEMKTVRLNSDNLWKYSWGKEDLPSEDSDGNPYYYAAKEYKEDEDGNIIYEPLGGYETIYTNNDGIQSGHIYITNTERTIKKTDVTVKKEWKDNDDQAIEVSDDKTVSVKIIQHTKEDLTDTGVDVGTTELSNANDWTHKWDDLDLSDVNGNQYYYEVKEDPDVEGFNTSYSNDGFGVQSGTIIITNNQKSTSITVIKKWQDSTGSDISAPENAKITVKLIQHTKLDDGGLNAGTEIKTVELSGSKWTETWDNLALNDVNGKAYYYTVEESTSVAGFNTSYENNEGVATGDINIVNKQKPTSITVTKKWQTYDDKDLSDTSGKTITATLIQYSDEGLTNEVSKIETFTLNDEVGWTKTWDNLAKNDEAGNPYYYSVIENKVPGYNTSYSNDGVGVQSGTIIVTNKKKTTEISAKKIWKNKDGSSTPGTDKVTMTLYRNIEGENPEILNKSDGKPETLELNTANEWKGSWKNLDAEDEVGNAYKYSVKENNVARYDTSYKNNDGIESGEIEVVNKENEPKNPDNPSNPGKPEKPNEEHPSENKPNGKNSNKNVKTGVAGVGSIAALLLAASALFVTSKKKKM